MLAAILRLADALDRSQDGRIAKLRCVEGPGVIQIQLQGSANCDREIFAAEQKRELFEQVFGRRLSFSRRAVLKDA